MSDAQPPDGDSPRMSDPGLRLSVSELEEIKPLASMPPQTPSDVAETFDLDTAMQSSLDTRSKRSPSVEVAVAPHPPRRARRGRSGAFPRWAQAVVAVALGASLALALQSAARHREAVANSSIAEAPASLAPDVSDEPAVMRQGASPTASLEEPRPLAEPPAEEALETHEESTETIHSIFDAPEEPLPRATAATTVTATTASSATTAATTRGRAEANGQSPARPERTEREVQQRLASDRERAIAAATQARERRERGTEAAGAQAERDMAQRAPPANLPEHPSRQEVQSAMEAIRGYMEACANGAHGQANMDITIHPSGRVQRARTQGTFMGTPEGSCMAREARRARFPRFSGEGFSINFPYRL